MSEDAHVAGKLLQITSIPSGRKLGAGPPTGLKLRLSTQAEQPRPAQVHKLLIFGAQQFFTAKKGLKIAS